MFKVCGFAVSSSVNLRYEVSKIGVSLLNLWNTNSEHNFKIGSFYAKSANEHINI